MGRKIICNNVDLLAFGKAGHDLFKESNKLRTGVARRGLAQHLAGFGVERGVERKRAVTVILKTVSLGSPGRERQDWIEPVQSLDGALFIDAKDGRMDWRLQIQANDVCSLSFKIRVVAGHVAAKPVGLTYIAVADAAGSEVRRHVWAGNRTDNKRASAEALLALILERLDAADRA